MESSPVVLCPAPVHGSLRPRTSSRLRFYTQTRPSGQPPRVPALDQTHSRAHPSLRALGKRSAQIASYQCDFPYRSDQSKISSRFVLMETPEQEEKLTGGNTAESVVRLGATVRKPVTKSTPAVHSFLKHLRAAGYEGSPEAFGFDEQGRQILAFMPGPLWYGGPPRTQTDLRRVGILIKALHDAAVSFEAPACAEWDGRSEPDGHDIICHNDLAPWNLVCGPDRWVFIDWDNAAPGTRLWDLAWAAISFPPFEPEGDLCAAASATQAILDGYGLETSLYGALVGLMVKRAREEYELIVQGAKANRQPWARLYIEGHHQYWGPVSDYIDRHASALNRMLISLNSLNA